MKIKKFAVCLMTAAMVMASSVLAFGAEALTADEQSIIDSLVAAGVPTEYVNQAKTYLAKDGVEVSAAEATEIKGYIAEAKTTAGTTELKKLTSAQKSAIADKVVAAGKVLDLTVVYNSSKESFTVKDKAGAVVFEAAASDVIKTTGANVETTVAVVAVLAAALAACGYAVSKKNA